MALISIRQYARLRGIDESAVRKRTVARGGPIPTHGRAKRIDPDEADRLWFATMSPSAVSTSRFQGTPEADAPPAGAGPEALAAWLGNQQALTQARTALLLTEVQLRRLRLEERRGALLDRQTTLAKLFTTIRAYRDAWLAWPARVGPEIAARFGLDQTDLMIELEKHVRRQLEEFAGVRLDLDGRRPQS
jgi:hypothetical protein